MKKIAIVSPSGKFYGSEQVLFDFLKTTSHVYDVYVPEGLFKTKLLEHGVHRISTYCGAKSLYAKLSVDMLCGKYDGVYINEGGHSRYIRLLSKLFPWKRFFIHIRLLEDTKMARLGTKRPNIEYISISDYITKEVKDNTGIDCHTIHDLYVPTQRSVFRAIPDSETIRAGIVGRITDTKGLADIVKFCHYVESLEQPEKKLELHFYGAVNEGSPLAVGFVEESKSYKNVNCIFHGFVDSKDRIYRGVSNMLHFNKIEPLGRIYFESLDYSLPLVGFQSGGIGEISTNLGLHQFSVSMMDKWEQKVFDILIQLPINWNEDLYKNAVEQMKKNFNPVTYTKQLEKIFDK